MKKTAFNLGSHSILACTRTRNKVGIFVGMFGLLAIGVMDLEGAAHAASAQGIKLQGIKLQGIKLQGDGLSDVLTGDITQSGLAGAVLQGKLADGRDITVHSFAGNYVDATVSSATELPTTTTLLASDLDGMTWQAALCDDTMCVNSFYRVAMTQVDTSLTTMPDHPSNADVTMFRVEFTLDDVAGTWNTVCDVNDDISDNPTDMGTFVDGKWDETGMWQTDGYTFSCPLGVIDKCTRGWGYKPWSYLPLSDGTDVSLGPLHLACVRAARADYCGSGVPYTQDGILIDMFDKYGFNVNVGVAGFSEEAQFDESGAVSLNHIRISTALVECEDTLPMTPPTGSDVLIHVWSDGGSSLPGNSCGNGNGGGNGNGIGNGNGGSNGNGNGIGNGNGNGGGCGN